MAAGEAADLSAPSGPCWRLQKAWQTAPMTRRAFLLALLALALGGLAYLTWQPKWQEQAIERAAIARCRYMKQSEQLDLAAIRERRARCDAMEAAFRKKW